MVRNAGAETISRIEKRNIPILYPYQINFWRDESQLRACNKSRQIGFTFEIALEGYVNGLPEKETTLYLSASRRQSTEILKYHRMFARFDGIELLKDTQEMIILPNGSEIWALPCSSNTIRGIPAKRVYVDELAHYKQDKAVMQAIAPAITRNDRLRYMTVVSTPLGKRGSFYDIMSDPNNGYSKHTIDIFRAISEGCPIDVDMCRRLVPNEIAFAQEYLCQFLDELFSLFTVDLINSCRDDNLEDWTIAECQAHKAQYIAGYDAGKKVDCGVFTVVEMTPSGGIVRHIKSWLGVDYTVQLDYMTNFCREINCQRYDMDATGVGEPLAEIMKKNLGGIVNPVTFTNQSKEFMINNLRIMFQDKKIKIPYHRTLITELHSLQRETTSAGNIRYRHEAGAHDDHVWSLALATNVMVAGDIAGHFPDDDDQTFLDKIEKPIYDNSVMF